MVLSNIVQNYTIFTKRWCQIGVNLEKQDYDREMAYFKETYRRSIIHT